MQHEIKIDGSTAICFLSEKLSFADSATFRKMIEDVAQGPASNCVIDVARLQGMDSAGLGMFMIALESLKASHKSLSIRSPRGNVQRMFDLAKMGTLLTIEP